MDYLKRVLKHSGEESRTISPENMTGEKGKSCMESSFLGKGRKGRASVPLNAGETITIAQIEGPGSIRHMWMTLTDKTTSGSFVLRDVILRIYWDDEEEASVECPIGDFFCNGFGTRCEINSLPIVVNPNGGMNCYFEMPFRKKAKITITNEHPEFIKHFFYTINYVLMDEISEDTLYFHAKWTREKITTLGKDYTLIDNIIGKGYYVGTYIGLAALERYWWGEGEFKFYIDGDNEYPTVSSTGAEDYFGGAWAFHEKKYGELPHAKNYCTAFMG